MVAIKLKRDGTHTTFSQGESLMAYMRPSQKTRPDREKLKLSLNLTDKITQEFVEIFQLPDKKTFLLPSVINCNNMTGSLTFMSIVGVDVPEDFDLVLLRVYICLMVVSLLSRLDLVTPAAFERRYAVALKRM
ncbi:Hypothetical predicted protein [Octopus vulgaris]|uniref:Uncharacterized protein n=1 Tax=Octopus vulgaris TaxID=6645 RepID=A0AA36AHE9_OCTVU|nr:Hypothetical predicted protein [Octopus vulgaris]